MKHKEWKSTGSCVYNTWYHLVWSTKYRGKVLVAPIDEAA
ncbi:MAG: IS200/IS605 family transposase, partial [Acidobacteriota bacterium]